MQPHPFTAELLLLQDATAKTPAKYFVAIPKKVSGKPPFFSFFPLDKRPQIEYN